MRRQLSTAAIVIALAATATACNSDGVDAKPDAGASAAPSRAPKDPAPAPDKPGAGQGGDLAVGGTATLKAKNGAQVAVTLKNWVDPATSDNKYMQPSAGKRWVAAQFEIANTRTVGYDDAPSNGVKVIDEQGQTFTRSMGRTTSGPNLPATVKLKTGEKALGYVVVSVPEGSKPKAVTFTPDSGFAKDSGRWVVAK